MDIGNWKANENDIIQTLNDLSTFGWDYTNTRPQEVITVHPLLSKFWDMEGHRGFSIRKTGSGIYELSLFGDPQLEGFFIYDYPKMQVGGFYEGKRWIPAIEMSLNELDFGFRQHLGMSSSYWVGSPEPGATPLQLRYQFEREVEPYNERDVLLAVLPSIDRRNKSSRMYCIDLYIRERSVDAEGNERV
ncbi:MAG: hypothetical protein ISS48_02990 [Candidatus Aenigmarchaeota archaeon]|nr:hypothetical protein [Candidatus Aenigmarchaeota archaeon]